MNNLPVPSICLQRGHPMNRGCISVKVKGAPKNGTPHLFSNQRCLNPGLALFQGCAVLEICSKRQRTISVRRESRPSHTRKRLLQDGSESIVDGSPQTLFWLTFATGTCAHVGGRDHMCCVLFFVGVWCLSFESSYCCDLASSTDDILL